MALCLCGIKHTPKTCRLSHMPCLFGGAKRATWSVGDFPSSFSVWLGHRSPSPTPSFPTGPHIGLVSTSPLHCPWIWEANSVCRSGHILISQSQYDILLASDYFGQSSHGIPLVTIIGPGGNTLLGWPIRGMRRTCPPSIFLPLGVVQLAAGSTHLRVMREAALGQGEAESRES